MGGPQSGVELVLLLLLIAVAAGLGAKAVRLPYTVALVLAGLATAFIPGMPRVALSPSVVLYVLLPAILFQAGLGLEYSLLRSNLPRHPSRYDGAAPEASTAW